MTATIARRGVDCSRWNGDPDGDLPPPDIAAYAKAGYRQLIRKVTEGTSYHWFYGDTVADQCHAHKVHVGHYHWLSEDQDPVDQAVAFVKAVKPHLGPPATTLYPAPDGDWLMDDVEQTAGVAFPGDLERAHQVRRFHAAVHRLLPKHPFANYTGGWYADGRPALQAALTGLPLVFAAYLPQLPAIPFGWNAQVWQYTAAAHVPGFAAPVDCNLFGIGAGDPHPTKDDQMTEDQVRKIAQGAVIDGLRAALRGEPRQAPFTHHTHPELFPANADHGVLDRLTSLEK